MRKSMKKVIASIAACTMAMAVVAGVVPTTASASVECSKDGKKAGKADFDPDGTYHAYLEFQQSESWVFRNSWFEPTLGQTGTDLEGDCSFDKVLKSGDNGVEVVDGTLTDAVIDGNGTYTVKVEGLDVTKLDPDAAKVSLLGISTDIPSAAIDDGTVKFTDVSWAIDGIDKGTVEPYMNADAKEWGLYQPEIINTYQQDGYVNPTMMLPSNGDISITFTVSGMSKDSTTANAATSDTSDTSAASSATSEVSASDSGISTSAVVAIVVVAVVVIAGIVVVVTKKKKN